MNSVELQELEIFYPESDGKPMADNTLQWDWMVKIVGELRELFLSQNVFIAGDLFWYPIQGDPKTVIAPDALVVFGRPPGRRGSYKQWLEDNIPPQVVFEVLSPSNTTAEMEEKLLFYQTHGVEEFYIIDPEFPHAEGFVRQRNKLVPIAEMHGHVSPLLNIRFQLDDELKLFTPDNREFQNREERTGQLIDEIRLTQAERYLEQQRAEQEYERAEQERERAERALQELEKERMRTARMLERLRQLGETDDL
jgi:hypothetical protein